MTLGAMIRDFQKENIFGHTDIQPFKVLVNYESDKRVSGHSYCINEEECTKQALTVLKANVSAITRFPTIYYYDAESHVHDISDLPCGVAVRRDADQRCSPLNLQACDAALNDLDNW